MYDDFQRYTLNHLSEYDHVIDRPSMGRWIFQHVLEIGYTNELFANYDEYTGYKYGGGRGKPVWAERIGKKYQWIALARLAARLTDHVAPQLRAEWNPKPIRTPLSFPGGRHIDPSVPLRSATPEKARAWWLPEQYNFEAVAPLGDEAWIEQHNDMPGDASLVSERADPTGKPWIPLKGFLEWSSKDAEADEGTFSRRIWLHMHSYLIPAPAFKACWRWLKRQQFMGGWMRIGAEYYEGFIGEYPWGTIFNMYEDTDDPYHGAKRPPCEMLPTCTSLSIQHEYDATPGESISFALPSRRFFEATPLRWNGEGGYISADGSLCFFDPSIVEPGPSVLLVDPSYLRAFLAANELVLVWIVFGEKQVASRGGARTPRLVYSRVHALGAAGLRSAQPVVSTD